MIRGFTEGKISVEGEDGYPPHRPEVDSEVWYVGLHMPPEASQDGDLWVQMDDAEWQEYLTAADPRAYARQKVFDDMGGMAVLFSDWARDAARARAKQGPAPASAEVFVGNIEGWPAAQWAAHLVASALEEMADRFESSTETVTPSSSAAQMLRERAIEIRGQAQ